MIRLEIEVGKFYRLRNGLKARIYAVDGGGSYKIHGAVFDASSPKLWWINIWRASGRQDSQNYEHGQDIVSEWDGE